MTISLVGCCGRKKIKEKAKKSNKKIDVSESLKKLKIKKDEGSKKPSPKVEDIDVDLIGQLPLREKDERTSELYEKLDRANSLYKNRNYDGALREIDRIQREIDNDPYLEMQTWGLAALIYDKTGKTSRRKRAYSKMFDSLVAVHKDPRYAKAREDGKICLELIEIAKVKGDRKYAEE